MGNVNGKINTRIRLQHKPVNHENIDVHRGRTLKEQSQKKLNCQLKKKEDPMSNIHCNTSHGIKTGCKSKNAFACAPPPSCSACSNQDDSSNKYHKCLKDGKVVNIPHSNCDTIKLTNSEHEFDSNSQISTSSSSHRNSKSQVATCVCSFRDEPDQEITNSSIEEHMSSTDNDSNSIGNPTSSSDLFSDPLTIEDVSRMLQMGNQYIELNYDAYVNFPKEYFLEAKMITERLEKPPYNFNLFLPQRQLLPGLLELDAKTYLVENRCSGKVISVLGKNYTKSDTCHFINHFAKSLDPVSKEAKLIPVMVDEIPTDEIPRIMKGLYIIRYNRDKERGFFWDKLYKSINPPPP